jgi:ornithine cyclodeaminase/alanine dehydrogenase-like protein (mu-crystallin family)
MLSGTSALAGQSPSGEHRLQTITEEQIKVLLEPQRVVDAIEEAFRTRFPTTLMPVRSRMDLESGIFLIMPCYDRAGRGLGTKLVTVRENPPPGEQKIHATYLLLDPQTGEPKLLAPASYITELRTAATSAVATKHLARADARVLGVFGTGRQARAHLQVLPLVRRFERVLVCGSEPTQSRGFSEEMADKLRVKIQPAAAGECAARADVICTCTTSPVPLFDGSLLRPGTHLNLVGAFQPHTREVDDVTVQRSKVVVDTYDGALAEAGDLLIPMRDGRITSDHVVADLHELLSGKKTVRSGPADITLFKNVGCALEDLVTVELVQTQLDPEASSERTAGVRGRALLG